MEITNAGDMQLLAARLEKEGFSTEEIEKIFYKNVFRVYREIPKIKAGWLEKWRMKECVLGKYPGRILFFCFFRAFMVDL